MDKLATFKAGRPVLVRFGSCWVGGVVVSTSHDTVEVDTAHRVGRVSIHKSVIRRDLRVAQ